MWWRLKGSEFEARTGDENQKSLRSLVSSGVVTGILAYHGAKPVGWCAVEPRGAYGRLNRSRILKPIDEQPVWSVVCFYVDRKYRGMGVTVQLLGAVSDYAKRSGADILEGYPIDPMGESYPETFVYTGLFSAFQRAGFRECARRSEKRPIMRRHLD